MYCVSCNCLTTKYKCIKCTQPYCSLDCYKKHSTVCIEIVKKEPTTVKAIEDQEPTCHDPFPTEDTVPREKLEQLRHSEGLQHILRNPHLRSLLQEIDVAPNAWRAMCAAMQEPLFIEFADECLKVVEPHEESDTE